MALPSPPPPPSARLARVRRRRFFDLLHDEGSFTPANIRRLNNDIIKKNSFLRIIIDVIIVITVILIRTVSKRHPILFFYSNSPSRRTKYGHTYPSFRYLFLFLLTHHVHSSCILIDMRIVGIYFYCLPPNIRTMSSLHYNDFVRMILQHPVSQR